MLVQELFSRSTELICFPPKQYHLYMMDAPFPAPLFAMHRMLDQPLRVRRKENPNNNALLLCHCNRNGVHIDSNSSARTHHNNIYMSSVLHFPIDGENTPLHHR